MFTFANSSLYAAAFSIAISTALFATAIIPASPAVFV